MGNINIGKKGQSKPVWILIGVFLALIVGYTMMQVITKVQEVTHMELPKAGDLQNIVTKCWDWYQLSPDFNPEVIKDDSMRNIAKDAKDRGLLTEEDYANGHWVTACDCAVVLYYYSITPDKAISFDLAKNRFEKYAISDNNKICVNNPKDEICVKRNCHAVPRIIACCGHGEKAALLEFKKSAQLTGPYKCSDKFEGLTNGCAK
jgi:hypothetical protein